MLFTQALPCGSQPPALSGGELLRYFSFLKRFYTVLTLRMSPEEKQKRDNNAAKDQTFETPLPLDGGEYTPGKAKSQR